MGKESTHLLVQVQHLLKSDFYLSSMLYSIKIKLVSSTMGTKVLNCLWFTCSLQFNSKTNLMACITCLNFLPSIRTNLEQSQVMIMSIYSISIQCQSFTWVHTMSKICLGTLLYGNYYCITTFKPHFTSTLVVTSHESNPFSMSAFFAFSSSHWGGPMQIRAVYRHTCNTNTEQVVGFFT